MSGYLSKWPSDAERRAKPIGSDRELDAIIAEVAARYGLTARDLKSDCRERWCAWPRQEAMAVAYVTGRFSTPRIGARLGGREHATVLHGIDRHRQRVAEGVKTPVRVIPDPEPPPAPKPAAAAVAGYKPPVRRLIETPRHPRALSPSQKHLKALFAALQQEARP